MTSHPRPVGFSILAILFALCVIPTARKYFPEDTLLLDAIINSFNKEPLRYLLGVLFLVFSALTAYGLWQMRQWAFGTYVITTVALVAGNLLKDFRLMTTGQTQTGWVGIVFPWVVIAAVLFLIGVYVKRVLAKSEPNKGATPNDGPTS